MDSLPTTRRGTEHGAALVELALVLPLVMALALGIFTGGAAYFRKLTIVDAVREGTRYGASLPLSTATGGSAGWETSVKGRITQASGGELATTDLCAKLVSPTGGSDCGVTDPPGASSEPGIHIVKVSATKGAVVQFFFFTRSTTLTSKLAARFERDTG